MTRALPLVLCLLAPLALAQAPSPDAGARRVARTLADVKLLYFHATWCSSCKKLDGTDVVERLRKLGLNVEVVDVDTNEPLLERYGVEHTPSFVLVDASGFPLGKPAIDLDRPDETFARVQKLVLKMTKR